VSHCAWLSTFNAVLTVVFFLTHVRSWLFICWLSIVLAESLSYSFHYFHDVFHRVPDTRSTKYKRNLITRKKPRQPTFPLSKISLG
jgi:hypothetical protein